MAFGPSWPAYKECATVCCKIARLVFGSNVFGNRYFLLLPTILFWRLYLEQLHKELVAQEIAENLGLNYETIKSYAKLARRALNN
ncbi:hypothetical protein NG798_12540 [Ancylothrix sp. C2]|nr:hypothetical protein [Ancylothrix sp. D3o]